MRDKEELINQIVAMDAGFDEVYSHIKELVERDHAVYETELNQMKDLIRQVIAKDVAIRIEEQQNYELAQKKFASVKKQVREVRASQKMVNSYYQNMMKQNRYEPQYMDNKK